VKAGLKGKDLLKNRDEVVCVAWSLTCSCPYPVNRPESIGLICASVYILLLILFIPFLFSDFFVGQTAKHGLEGLAAASVEFPHHQVKVFFTRSISFSCHVI
jgi:UDP-N-acetylglucosamine--dolichyl-phosphate N-acetylglucosaminephosphotransferase